MSKKCELLVVLGLLAYLGGTRAQNDAGTATFNMKGVTGSITFTPDGDNTKASISLNVSKGYTWEIREFPVIVSQKDPCNDSMIGDQLHDLTPALDTIDASTPQSKEVILTSISLSSGEKAILGRSVLLISGSDRACAAILPQNTQVSFATINGHVAGSIHVFNLGTRYAILSDLFSTQAKEPMNNIELSIYKGAVKADLPGTEMDVPQNSERCTASEFATSMTSVADVVKVPIAGAGTIQRSMKYISLTDASFDFTSGWVKIGSEVPSCANLHLFERKEVSAMFSSKGVSGKITFNQDNPYVATKLNVSLLGLNSTAKGYHIHQFPIGYRYNTESNICGSDFTGGHFIPIEQLKGTESTQDYFEFGDISSKHGDLAGKDEYETVAEDWYMPLFGQYSIVGRSIVIHKADNARWVCANIGYPGPVITAVADFNFFAQGKITLTQEVDKPWADTTIFVQMNTKSASSQGHNYHLHSNPVGDDASAEADRCKSAGGHWNPFDVAYANNDVYKAGCSENDLGCEVGDLSGKFGPIDLEAVPDAPNGYFYSDSIPLSGVYSVLSKSITIHDDAGKAGRFACADIKQKLSTIVVTDKWMSAESQLPEGELGFSQTDADGVSMVSTNLKKLNNRASGLHVHQTPMNEMNPGSNICGTTGGHFRPFGASSTTPPGETLDEYEVGDISNKFGSLADKDEYAIQRHDTNMPLEGLNSIAGRSVVVHYANSSRWACANVVYDEERMGGTLVQAMATFDSANVKGFVKMSQVVSEHGSSDVTVEVLLNYANDKESTKDHKWHVHENIYDGSSCSSTGGHYNPFNADVIAASYATNCKPSDPKSCEFGDMSGKFNKVNIGGDDNHQVFNDGFLTLTGKYSVMGRSVVIHDKDGGAGRLFCADLVPYKNFEMVQVQINKQEAGFRQAMATKIAEQLGVTEHTIYVQSTGEEDNECASVVIYFTGPNAASLRSKFDDTKLGEFSASKTCASGAGSIQLTASMMFALVIAIAGLY